MTKTVRSRYTLEFKQEAVRLVQSGQSMAAVSRSLGVVRITESGALAWHAVRDPPCCQGRGHRLAAVVQQPKAVFNAGLQQPHAIRATLARGTAENSEHVTQLWDSHFEGKVTQRILTVLTSHGNAYGT